MRLQIKTLQTCTSKKKNTTPIGFLFAQSSLQILIYMNICYKNNHKKIFHKILSHAGQIILVPIQITPKHICVKSLKGKDIHAKLLVTVALWSPAMQLQNRNRAFFVLPVLL